MGIERAGRARDACGKMVLASLLFAAAGVSGAWAQGAGVPAAAGTADPSVWGVYAQLVGHEWRGWRDVSVQWSDDGAAIVETWKRNIESGERARELLQTMTIRPDGAGRLVATIESIEDWQDGTYTGRVRGDGSVAFRMRGRLLQDNETTVEMESPTVARFYGGWTAVQDMRAYAADSAREPSPAQWGAYAALAGRTWLISDTWGPMLVTVDWLVRGQLLVERIEWLDAGTSNSRETWVSPDGSGLLARDAMGGPMHYGTVSADGSVAFHTRNLFARGQDWKVYLRDGKPRYLGMGGVDVAYEEVGPERIKVLMAEATRAREERAAQARAEQREKSDRFLATMGALSGALSAAQEVASYNEAQSRAALDATLAEAGRAASPQAAAAPTASASAPASAPASATAPIPAARPAVDAGGQPLRFVMSIGMTNKPGDTVNPTCYSNLITRPGPPGWGTRGSASSEAYQQAKRTVDGYKAAFFAKCRAASQREIVSEGNFFWVWNEGPDDEARVRGHRAGNREDVTVTMD